MTAAVKPLWKQVAPRTDLWMPPGTAQEESVFMGRSNPDLDNDVAFAHKFTFKYKGKQKEVWITADADATHSEIEDLAGKEVETWIDSLNQEEHLPAPTAQQKKEIGKVLNEIRTHGIKRRLSSNNRIYFPGVN